MVFIYTTLVGMGVVLLTTAAPSKRSGTAAPVFETTCAGESYAYNELAGFGSLPSDARDKFGDTMAGIGSSIAIDKKSWKKEGDSWTGLLFALPDRGWNTEGSINYNPRVHKLMVTFSPSPAASPSNPSGSNIHFEYLDSILLKSPDGAPCTGLDADATGGLSYPGFPLLPAATFTGDGFGNDGPGGKRVSIDSEGIVLTGDGGFWISDEYGPYVYQFDQDGLMINAIAPPDAILPVRNGSVSFSSNSPPRFNPEITVTPEVPAHGRQNNQGFEGLTASPDGKTLYVLLQSAAIQEGGNQTSTRWYTRFLEYDISECGGQKPSAPTYVAEWVVPLPTYTTNANKTAIAAQSEVHYISKDQFLVLARDSGAGQGQDSSTSLYRHIDIFDISKATNVKGEEHDSFTGSIASSKGILNSGITAATYCPFIDFNINAQLNRFGVHNGGEQDANLLTEKWESIAVLPLGKDDEYYILTLNDNDFITQNGYIKNGTIQYKDESGFDLPTQALMFKVTLPKGAKPLQG